MAAGTLTLGESGGGLTRVDVGIGGDLQIGRDGSVWVISGGTVARLPVTVPL